MSRQTSLPDDFEILDFTVEEEHWNEYELVDGSRVKGRLILRIIIRDPNNPNAYSFDFHPAFYAVYAPQANRGERNNEPRPEEYFTLPNYEVRITRNDEKWNKYRILRTGQVIKVKLTITEIHRITDRFDKDGIPFYLITAGPTVVAGPPNGKLQP